MIKPDDIQIKTYPTTDPNGIKLVAHFESNGIEQVTIQQIDNSDGNLIHDISTMMRKNIIKMVVGDGNNTIELLETLGLKTPDFPIELWKVKGGRLYGIASAIDLCINRSMWVSMSWNLKDNAALEYYGKCDKRGGYDLEKRNV